MALPNTNISVAMVKAELGAATNDVGQLCIHPSVNKWSRWKPVRHNSVVPITEGQLQSTNYGLDFPIFSNVQAYISHLTSFAGDRSVDWDYLPPTGGASSPYRLDDFKNYDKDAVSPVGMINVDYTPLVQGGRISAYVIAGDGTDTQIGWGDIAGQRKLAFAVATIQGDVVKTVIAEKSSDWLVEWSITGIGDDYLNDGDYRVFVFLTNSSGGLTQIAGIHGHREHGYLIAVETPTISVVVSADWDNFDRNKLHVRVSGRNTTSQIVNLTSCRGSVRFGDSDCDDYLLAGEVNLNPDATIELPITTQFGVTLFEKTVTVDRGSRSWKVCWDSYILGTRYNYEIFIRIPQDAQY